MIKAVGTGVVMENGQPDLKEIADFVTKTNNEDGAVMGISHREIPLYGVQFHPEAVLTEYGHELLENFCCIAEKFNKNE